LPEEIKIAMTSIRHQYILVGVETDPTQYRGEDACRPALLERSATEQILSHLAADLSKQYPAISRCSLTMAGALFDQTQILRPDKLVYKALESFQNASNPGSDFQPRLLSIGAGSGKMPVLELQPFENIALGLLQVLPLLLSGPADLITELSEEMELRFLEDGQLSAHAATALQSQFKISLNHARFMTVTDLNAMLRLQLEHYGFLPLWQLLDTAINLPDQILEVTTAEGLNFKWYGGAVHSYFESFDWWANYGGGSEQPANMQGLQSAYTDWTREYRRYLTMLAAHGVTLAQHLPGLDDAELSDSFLVEQSTCQPAPSSAQVTEHHANDLGVIAVTVVSEQQQMNLYPLLPGGLNDLHHFIRSAGHSGDVAFSAGICYDESSRQLLAGSLGESLDESASD
jgi:hypothetical protein